jgi:hypothetical protein
MTEQSDGSGAPTAAKCLSAGEMLAQVTKELNEFDAKKLGELKSELEAFVKNQEKLVKDYEAKYPSLREKWCLQQQQVQQLHAAVKCAFPPPSEPWKKIVEECICKKKHELRCLEERHAKRKRCCSGPLERARDRAKALYDAAKARLDALTALAAKVESILGEDATLIKDTNALMSGPDHAVVLWLFWFKLLPQHKQLAPSDVEDSCKTFADEETPAKLCEAVWCKPCDPEEEACKPTTEETEGGKTDPGRPVPWLIPPKDYGTALDCAWQDYRAAKDALAKADSAFKEKPDDLASLAKAVEDRKKAIEEEIKKCLKDRKPDDNCCKKPTDTGCEERTNA